MCLQSTVVLDLFHWWNKSGRELSPGGRFRKRCFADLPLVNKL